MSDFTISPNMGLTVPTVGVDPGPDWANNINASLSVIDGHDHSPGKGVAITPSGLNISSDLDFLQNNAINLRSARFFSQNSPLSGASDIGAIYVSGVDLYYNNVSGVQIRITQGGGVAGTPGSIANLTPPASASYVSVNQTFVWQSGVNTAANMDGGSVIIREVAASAKGITLSSPTSLASDYTLILPTALPAVTSYVTMTPGGNISANRPIKGATIQVFTSGSGTYTTPTNPSPLYLKVKMVAGGGGGGGFAGNGSAGGDTTFGTALLSCMGGGGGGRNGVSTPGAGGTYSISGSVSGWGLNGASGAVGGNLSVGYTQGGAGGSSPFGGNGLSAGNSDGGNANINTGSGGAGAGNAAGDTSNAAGGGGSGGYIEAIISSPASTYAYSVGALGAGGPTSSPNYVGGNGAAGQIIVEEYYN